jgi:signal peptidase
MQTPTDLVVPPGDSAADAPGLADAPGVADAPVEPVAAGRSASFGKWVGRAVLALVLAAAAVLGGLLETGRYEAHPVLTGSMRPGFALGSVVVLKRVPVSSLAQGDVILFHRPDDAAKLVVHRIYSMTTKHGVVEIRTRGDDNPEPDAWTVTVSGRYAYQAEFTVPFVGYASLWFDSPGTRLGIFLGIVGGLVLYGAFQFLKRPEVKPEPKPAD